MTSFAKQQFDGFLPKPGSKFTDIAFENCEFLDCTLTAPIKNIGKRPILRNIHLTRCRASKCGIHGVVIEECLVEDLKILDGLLLCWGAVLKHVVLKGPIGPFKVHPGASIVIGTDEERDALLAANKKYYENVDWALDISQARFEDVEFRGVPANLVRRDPETQCVISRSGLLETGDKLPKLQDTFWSFIFGQFLRDGFETQVVAAPLLAKAGKAMVKDIKILRKAGIALPD